MGELQIDAKAAVLDQKVTDLKEIVLKLEEAIERINDVNSNVTKMLVAHEERINNNEHNTQALFEKVWEINKSNDNIDKKIIETESKFNSKLQKINEAIYNTQVRVSAAFVVIIFSGFIITNASFFSNLLELGKPDPDPLTNHTTHGRVVPR